MNNSTSSAQCDLARELLSPSLKIVITIELIIASLTIWPNLLLLLAARAATVLPSNLRLLLAHFSGVLILVAIANIVKGMYLLLIDPCDFRLNHIWCKLLDLANNGLPFSVMYYNVFTLCMERLYATMNYRQYDHDRRPTMAVVSILVTWLVACGVNGWPIVMLSSDNYVPFCDNIFLPSPSAAYVAVIYFTLESAGAAITVFIVFYNRYLAKNMAINRALYDLSARFLVDQNVQINSMITPSMALHFVCHLPTYGLLISVYTPAIMMFSPTTRLCMSRATILLRLVYALFDPIIAFGCNAHLRQHLANGPVGRMAKWTGISDWKIPSTTRIASTVGNGPSHKAHFDYLSQMWEKSGKTKKTSIVA